ncbi:MAG: hypothetical protein ACTSSF_07025 [Candidatus Heimdallarchaeaceae archaeon]
MKIYNPKERVQLYTNLHSFLHIISKETEREIEEGNFDDIILESPIIALTAKNMVELKKTDDRNILFSLSRTPHFLFPSFNEKNIKLYSQAELVEVLEFNELYIRNIPLYSPRMDNELIVLLKIEFYINSFLYFAKTMLEKRYPFGKEYYDFLSFLIHEYFVILKPQILKENGEFRNYLSVFSLFLNYTTILYLFDHFPEQASELTFILNNIPKLNIKGEESHLLSEILENSILISRKEKNTLLTKISQTNS